jgi:hypothetical protein
MPKSNTQIIESKIFNINDFKFLNKIEKKNANFLLRLIDNSIALTNGSKISIYNENYYFLIYEFDIYTPGNDSNDNMVIICNLYQMKNQNIICGTNFGDIYIFEKDLNLEMYKGYPIKTISLEGVIFKIDKFCPNLIGILSKIGIKIYDDINFNEKFSINFKKLFIDFVQISDNELSLLSENMLSFYKIKEDKINKKYTIEINCSRNKLISTNKYLIVGGKNCIYYIDYTQNQDKRDLKETQSSEIKFIHKIHNELFLASTNNGEILQIIMDDKNKLNIISKISTYQIINSIIYKNYQTILFTNDAYIEIWTSPKEDKKCILI